MVGNRPEESGRLKKITTDYLSACYEVIRVIDGIFLFLEDHLNRLRNSVTKMKMSYNIDNEYLINILLKLQIKNKLITGNVKLMLAFPDNQASLPDIFAYEVFHLYPVEREIRKGVRTSLFLMERENPNIKMLNSLQQDKCRLAITDRRVYEVLLVDQHGCVTEGSKSNLFLIREGSVFTPPGDRVLKGITREKVMTICKKMHFRLSEKEIAVRSLPDYEAAFITGTSSKVLPIAYIDGTAYDPKHPVLDHIKTLYDKLIEDYIKAIRQRGYCWDPVRK
jgi:branched-chain amino acid aminotransferase